MPTKKTTLKAKENLILAPIKRVKVEEETKKPTVAELLKSAGMESDAESVAVEPITEKTEENKVSVREVSDMNSLIGALGDIDQKFEGVTDADYYRDQLWQVEDDLNLEKVEVPEIDEEKIKAEIIESESAKNEIKKNDETKKVQSQEESKQNEISSLIEDAENEKTEIGEVYDNYKKSTESDIIKRGLARSSVAVLSMDNIEAGRAKELSRVAENLSKSIAGVEKEIEALKANLEVSLENLDLELAQNINKAINEKISDLKEKQQEAIEFNNSVKKIEAEYKLKLDSKKKEAAEFEQELAEKYEGAAQADKREQKLKVAMDYFGTMDKFSALSQIIGNSELARSLGDDYYDLYYYVMRG